MKLGPLFVGAATASLYPHGKANGDIVLNMDGNGISKVPLKNLANIFGADKDVLWVSNNGAISFNSLDDPSLESLKENFVIAPLWGVSNDNSVPSIGKVFYRTVTKADDLSAIEADINLSDDIQTLGNFQVDTAFMATYKNVQNPLNSEQKNQYQVVVASGFIQGTVSEKTIVLFNYHMLDWTPESANVGIFAAAAESEQCHAFLNQNLFGPNLSDLSVGSNIGETGKWIMIHTRDLECIDSFETECPEPEEGTRATMSGMMSLMGSCEPEDWEFYAFHTCIPDHAVSKGVNTVTSACVYDADYYDARWQHQSPTCIDEQAVKTFAVTLVVDKIGSEDAKTVVGEGSERGENNILVETGISELMDYIGLSESQVQGITITPYDPEGFKDPEKPKNRAEEITGAIQVEFELKLPLAVKDKVTEVDVAENIKNILSELPIIGDLQFDEEDVLVEDKTPSCLTECLGCQDPKNCGSKPPPLPFDACCGSCPEDNPSRGKPYSSILKSCCQSQDTDGWTGEIYDPTTHVCCNGDVVDKAEYAVSLFTRSQCN